MIKQSSCCAAVHAASVLHGCLTGKCSKRCCTYPASTPRQRPPLGCAAGAEREGGSPGAPSSSSPSDGGVELDRLISSACLWRITCTLPTVGADVQMHSAGTSSTAEVAGRTYARAEGGAAAAAAAATTAGRAAAAGKGSVFAIEEQFTSAHAYHIITLHAAAAAATVANSP